jgi:hypothetical protein
VCCCCLTTCVFLGLGLSFDIALTRPPTLNAHFLSRLYGPVAVANVGLVVRRRRLCRWLLQQPHHFTPNNRTMASHSSNQMVTRSRKEYANASIH